MQTLIPETSTGRQAMSRWGPRSDGAKLLQMSRKKGVPGCVVTELASILLPSFVPAPRELADEMVSNSPGGRSRGGRRAPLHVSR